MSDNLFKAYIDAKNKDKKNNENKGYTDLIHNWCYRQMLGLFPIEGEPKKGSPHNLFDHYPRIKKLLILKGRCVSMEVGGQIVVVEVLNVVKNLSRKIKQVEILLGDANDTKITLFTKLHKTKKNKVKELNWEEMVTPKDEKVLHFVSRLGSKGQLIEEKIPFVYWSNNSDETADLNLIDPVLSDLEGIRGHMNWDRKKSRKQVIVVAERRPNGVAWEETKRELEEDYVCLIENDTELPEPTKSVIIKDIPSKQADLWGDFWNVLDFLSRMIGIVHNDSKKKERQQNPEVAMIESQYSIFQQDKKDYLEKGIRDWIENFGGEYELISRKAFDVEEEKEKTKLIENSEENDAQE